MKIFVVIILLLAIISIVKCHTYLTKMKRSFIDHIIRHKQNSFKRSKYKI